MNASREQTGNKKPSTQRMLGLQSGGAGGIRTRGGLLTHTRFPGVRLKPLIHRSVYEAAILA